MSPPAGDLLARRPYTVFTALMSHATLSALVCQLALFTAVAPDAQDALGRGRAAALFLLGGAAANLVGAAGHGLAFGGGGGGRRGERLYVPPPWASPRYTMGAGGGCCVLLGYLAAAAAEQKHKSVADFFRAGFGSFFGSGGGWGAGSGGGGEVAYWLFGLQLTAAQLLFAVLGSQALGFGAGTTSTHPTVNPELVCFISHQRLANRLHHTTSILTAVERLSCRANTRM